MESLSIFYRDYLELLEMAQHKQICDSISLLHANSSIYFILKTIKLGFSLKNISQALYSVFLKFPFDRHWLKQLKNIKKVKSNWPDLSVNNGFIIYTLAIKIDVMNLG